MTMLIHLASENSAKSIRRSHAEEPVLVGHFATPMASMTGDEAPRRQGGST